jgi:hypothetical protein
LNPVQQRVLQAVAFAVAAAEGIAAKAAQAPLQERKSSLHTRWSPGRQVEGISLQKVMEQRLAQADARVESASLRQ